ncbi:MAG: MBL fold metallo-hydrolase [Proteiniphilum sp.]|jgi:phosphoribosyl 1,2-cyclic phosphodiesterase|nr:MBL fold metallo-hydrolase [Proteiniphilum sp.]
MLKNPYPPEERISFFSLSSGSCGNSCYLGSPRSGILIDAGIGPRVIKKRLAHYGIELPAIMALLITHDHSDHIKSAAYLGGKLHIPVYATREVHRAITKQSHIRHNLSSAARYIEKGTPFQVEAFSITAFDVPHDSIDNSGYFIRFGTHTFTLATDVGAITGEVARYIRKANHLVIESNYDEALLNSSRYPHFLKQRITSGTGHLSNRQTAEFLADNYSPTLRNIWLCHLSGDNNDPQLAYRTVESRLAEKGIKAGRDVALHVLQRNILSQKTEF